LAGLLTQNLIDAAQRGELLCVDGDALLLELLQAAAQVAAELLARVFELANLQHGLGQAAVRENVANAPGRESENEEPEQDLDDPGLGLAADGSEHDAPIVEKSA